MRRCPTAVYSARHTRFLPHDITSIYRCHAALKILQQLMDEGWPLVFNYKNGVTKYIGISVWTTGKRQMKWKHSARALLSLTHGHREGAGKYFVVRY